MPCPFHFASKGTPSGEKTATPAESTLSESVETPETPARRTLLKGLLGAAGGALAYSGVAHAATSTMSKPMSDSMSSMDDDAFMSEQKVQPFYGMHQSGIATPQQANVALLACDILAQNKADLKRLFKTLTARSEFLMSGGQAPTRDDKYPPLDSGILGPQISPDNLTITVSVGASLFDDRYGLASLKPLHLQRMTEFPNDGLRSEWCHGDLMIQICANSPDTTLHAVRDIIKHTPDTLTVRWRRDGFISPHAAASMGKRTPINLLGFKDGTVNPPANQAETFDKVVWVGANHQEPAWAVGGSYQAIRLIRFFVEHWDRTPLQEQEAIFGRERATGAPLGMKHEHDDPDYANDPDGKRIPLTSHMRLANPRTKDFPEFLLLRRGYSYSYNATPSGQLDVGLMFIAYQANLETGFIATQNRLNGEELEEYIKPFGGGYFFTLPGVKHAGEYFAQRLLEI